MHNKNIFLANNWYQKFQILNKLDIQQFGKKVKKIMIFDFVLS